MKPAEQLLSHLAPDAIREQSRPKDSMELDHGQLAVVAGDAAAVVALLGSFGDGAGTVNEVIACVCAVAIAHAAVVVVRVCAVAVAVAAAVAVVVAAAVAVGFAAGAYVVVAADVFDAAAAVDAAAAGV